MWRLFMIVGNGKIGDNARETIAEASFVVRFNDCRSAGEDASRTDVVVVCNTGRPAKAMLSDRAWRTHPSVRAASEIWCVRDPQKFAEMRAPLAVSHPELDDFCDDYTDDFRRFAEETGKALHVISRDVHERLDDALSAFAPEPYVAPSTGIVTIAHMIESHLDGNDRIALAGFSHEGWKGHPFEAERRYLAPLEASGLVMRVSETELNRTAAGVNV